MAGGVIDADYRGEIKIIMVNNGTEVLRVHQGDRVGQLILEKIVSPPLRSTSSLSSTRRGDEGFGSTGVSIRRLGGGSSDLNESSSPSLEPLTAAESPARTIALEAAPTHVFFEDVHLSREGESMAQFLARLKSHELRDQGVFEGMLRLFSLSLPMAPSRS